MNGFKVAPAKRVLRKLGMPPEEIRVVLHADDARQVRRHLELHRERMLEELAERHRTLAALEAELADAALERSHRIDPIRVGSRSTGDRPGVGH